MRGILSDVNSEGHLDRILAVWQTSPDWTLVWTELDLIVETFNSLGLAGRTPDNQLWRLCQQEELILITGNRNQDGPTSLESVIREENSPQSLPVITLANSKRVIAHRGYAEVTAIRILEILIDMPRLLGSGRLYAP